MKIVPFADYQPVRPHSSILQKNSVLLVDMSALKLYFAADPKLFVGFDVSELASVRMHEEKKKQTKET